MVISISEKAADKAKNILTVEGKDGWGLRIYNAGQSCCGPSYGLDIEETPGAEDEILEKNGLKIFVDRQSMETLKGMQLDYYEDDEREGFVLTGGPASSCGSGCSSCG